MKQTINLKGTPPPAGAYSLALRAGDFIFTSGRSSRNEAGQIVGDTIEEQTRNVMLQIQALLEAGGATLDDLVKVTVHLSDINLFQRYNVVYAEMVPSPRPVRTTVASELGKGLLIEIDATAYVGALSTAAPHR